MTQMTPPQHFGDLSHPHRHARMSGVRLLHGVHCQSTQDVHHVPARCGGTGNCFDFGDGAHARASSSCSAAECSDSSWSSPRYFAPIRISSTAYKGRSGSASDVRTTSAALKFWPIVHKLGVATVNRPAAFAERTPISESSNAIARWAGTPSRSRAKLYMSGAGFFLGTTSPVAITSNHPTASLPKLAV